MNKTLKPYIMLAILGVVGTHANASGTTLAAETSFGQGTGYTVGSFNLGTDTANQSYENAGYSLTNFGANRPGEPLARPSRPNPKPIEPKPIEEEPTTPPNDDGVNTGGGEQPEDGEDVGGGETDGGETDGGETDGGETDGGETDGGETDGEDVGGGETDGGETDGEDVGGGETDGGETDGGETDGGETDGGVTDGEDVGGGVTDGGETDGTGDGTSTSTDTETDSNPAPQPDRAQTISEKDETPIAVGDTGSKDKTGKDEPKAKMELLEPVAENDAPGLAPMAGVLDQVRLNDGSNKLVGDYWNNPRRASTMLSLKTAQPLFGVYLSYLVDDIDVPLKLTHFDYEPEDERSLGAEYVYERLSVGGENGFAGFDGNTHGIKIFYFKRFDDRLQTYFEGKYARTSAKTGEEGIRQNATADRFSILAEGFYTTSEHTFIDLQGAFLKGDIQGSRRISMNDKIASMNSDATQYQIKASGGYQNEFLKTYVGLERKGLSIDPYLETGADAFNLSVDKEQVIQNNVIAGVAAIKKLDSGLKLHLEGTLRYQINDPSRELTVRFASTPDKPFVLKNKGSRLGLGLRAKASYPIGKNMDLFAAAGWDHRGNKNLYSAHLSLSKTF